MNNKDDDHELWDEEWLLANKNQRGLIKDLKVNKRWTGSGKIQVWVYSKCNHHKQSNKCMGGIILIYEDRQWKLK